MFHHGLIAGENPIVRRITVVESLILSGIGIIDQIDTQPGIGTTDIDVFIIGSGAFLPAVIFAPLLEKPAIGATASEIIYIGGSHITIGQSPHSQSAIRVTRFRRARHDPNALFELPIPGLGPSEQLPIVGTKFERTMIDHIFGIGESLPESVSGIGNFDLRKIRGAIDPKIVIRMGKKGSDSEINKGTAGYGRIVANSAGSIASRDFDHSVPIAHLSHGKIEILDYLAIYDPEIRSGTINLA